MAITLNADLQLLIKEHGAEAVHEALIKMIRRMQFEEAAQRVFAGLQENTEKEEQEWLG